MDGQVKKAKNEAESIFALTVLSTPENAVKLVHEGKFSALLMDSKPMEILTFSREATGQGDQKDRTKGNNGAGRQGATSQPEVNVAIKGTSELLTAE